MRMRNVIAAVAASALIASLVTARADFTFKDAGTVTRTAFGFVCFTTKLCSASVPIDSAGADMTDATNHVLFIDTRASGNLFGAATAGTAASGATYPPSLIGFGWKDGSGNIQPVAGATPPPFNIGQFNGVTPLMGNGVTGTGSPRVTVASDNTPFGTLLVDAAGTNKATVKAASSPSATTDTALVTSLRPATPMTPVVAAASDNHAVIKNGAGIAFSVHASNNSATKNYARLYDAGTGFNGCNSATGVIFAFEIPPNDSGFSIALGGSRGIAFTNGLSFCITSGFGLSDTTNATASAILFNASYN